MDTTALPGLLRPTLHQQGFSLIELAVVLVIVSLLLGGLLWPLSSQIDQQRLAENKTRLAIAREALLAHAAAHARLPCPDDPATTGAGNTGKEEFQATPAGDTDNGLCKVWDGFLPGSQLGLSNLDSGGHYLDGWGTEHSRVRYAVSNKLNGALEGIFTGTNRVKGLALAAMGDATDNIHVCESSTGITATNCGVAVAFSGGKSIFVVYSLGKNAAEVVTNAVTPAADEAANVNGDLVFISHQPVANPAAYYDDHLEWVGVYAYINHMMKAGVLP